MGAKIMFRQRFKAKDGSEPDKRNKINATKVEAHGITFDSKLELYLYDLLTAENIPFNFQVTYVLQEGFTFLHEAVLPIKIIMDFELYEHNIIVDSKGLMLPHTQIKHKMFRKYLNDRGEEPRIELPSSQKACRKLVESIRQGFFTVDEPITENAATRRKNKLTKAGFWWEHGRWYLYNDVNFEGYDASYIMSLCHYDFEELLLKHK